MYFNDIFAVYLIDMNLSHRKIGRQLFWGKGLEIGALHEHTILPKNCEVDYADAVTKEQAAALFPEIDANKLVDVKFIIDLDKTGLKSIGSNSYDFVILSHVIEHVANPINVVNELFRVCKPGGLVLIAAPDKEYTFDKKRTITPFEHLWSEYQQGIQDVTDEHYLDFIQAVHPECMTLPPAELQKIVAQVKSRREHAHVWTSHSFEDFLKQSFDKLNIKTRLVMKNMGQNNKLEFYSIWQKTDDTGAFEMPQLNMMQKLRLAIRI